MFAAKVLVWGTAIICAVNSAPNGDVADHIKEELNFHAVNPNPQLPTPNPADHQFNNIDYGKKEQNSHIIIPVSIPLKKIFTVSEEKLQWTEARNACFKKGLKLTSPTTLDLDQKLKNYIVENDLMPVDKFAGYWIGGHRDSHQSPWFWELAETKIDDHGWLPGEPNYYIGEDCVELKNDRGILGWNNYYCIEPKRYICEGIYEKEWTETSGSTEEAFNAAGNKEYSATEADKID